MWGRRTAEKGGFFGNGFSPIEKHYVFKVCFYRFVLKHAVEFREARRDFPSEAKFRQTGPQILRGLQWRLFLNKLNVYLLLLISEFINPASLEVFLFLWHDMALRAGE